MTFSEYYNALYPYLSDGDTSREVFYDNMIRHFICEEAQGSCSLLLCMPDTKKRYIKEKNPNKIKPEYARYAYSKHDPQRYRNWLKEMMFEQDSFDKIEEWLIDNNIEFNDNCEACDTLLENIFFSIAYPNVSGSGDVNLPPAADTTAIDDSGLAHLAEKDQRLLRDFHIDFDNILEKCIKSDQTEVWFTGRFSRKISRLYEDKWNDLISEFTDIRLKTDILNTVATLQEFCDAMDPDAKKIPTTPIRKLRTELRNCYVKIHPDKYADIFPYDAFIDDWNDVD